MSPLATRLKALSKALERGKELPPEVLERLEACLDEIDIVLPPARRGRPKQPELSILPWFVDLSKKLGMKTDKVVLQRLLGRTGRGNLKTLQNKLAQARKLRH
ncbi:hypothetical protein ACUTAF_19630 [Pseudomonas sp. SP16.1]|uniref:hypothetical protein n=1 Tax=Pseudomonas sp. SP16.1 TaxID=3458854 RepID=UPI0040463201